VISIQEICLVCVVGQKGHTMRDIVLKYPTWQEPYRAAITETNPRLLKQKISAAEQAAKLRFNELENSVGRLDEQIALTDALRALKTLGESDRAD
jgi:hypothetical protein